jgi:hypothetical protein
MPLRTASQLNRAQQLAQALGDPAVQQMLEGLNTLLQRALAFRGRDKTVELDRLQITYDLARMRWKMNRTASTKLSTTCSISAGNSLA